MTLLSALVSWGPSRVEVSERADGTIATGCLKLRARQSHGLLRGQAKSNSSKPRRVRILTDLLDAVYNSHGI